jgi:hypothetical protein
MLYYNSSSISLADYYKKGYIATLLKYDEKGIYYREKLIPYSEMYIFTNKRGSLSLTSRFTPYFVVLGNIDDK